MDISFNRVSYIYQQGTPFEHRALKDISFSLNKGEWLAIVGHTGSGKSTLLQHLNGLRQPTEGEVKVGDFHLSKKNRPKDMKQLRKHVGVVFQYPEHQLFEETVQKDLLFGPKNFGIDESEFETRVHNALAAVGLHEDVLERSPFELSGGQKRRVAIAGVLVTDPQILVLDEPTAGLDPMGQKEIMDMFYHLHQTKGRTTVSVTHDMEMAFTYADRIIVLENGQKLIEGTPHELTQQETLLQQAKLDLPERISFVNKWNQRNSSQLDETMPISELAQKISQELKEIKDQ
ncbi:ABC transporter ATP-binding protein [Gracilibacillus halophilus YIM-C55.5]|uniref:Energy-coupling factor transporter ATP-binding protein EcfA2 n=1 Tax=Gracilibacillus halophilus YIM-C55.5 TaxID=1308866 RepID=N4WEW7_9BACI|nr:energy-coupling factor transporter ATPase [Gracilibacillus halophilus]ENH97809.1 ABC transporter ATP-binding protein [Gracilibacillus halophilus YIM-C55.5]